jgi:hypothetical protein
MEEKLKKCQETNSSLAASLEQLLQKAIQDHFSGQDAKVPVKKETQARFAISKASGLLKSTIKRLLVTRNGRMKNFRRNGSQETKNC